MESSDSFQRICRRLTHLNNEGFTIMTRMLLTLVLTDSNYSGFCDAVDKAVSV